MKVKKESWLVLGIFAFVLWMVVISACVVCLYDTQSTLIASVKILWNDVDSLYDYIYEPFSVNQVSLSDETKDLVEDLRWKHYGHGTLYATSDNFIGWNRDFLSIFAKDGILYVETQDGQWFIDMQEVE